MFLWLWYYFSGYVIIKITGYGVARFMNMLSYKGIYIWDVKHEENGVIMKINRSSLPYIDDCSEKTGCTMAVLGQGGIYSWIKNSKNQQVFIYGILVFAISLYMLSLIVWTVEIKGNERILTSEISEFCNEIGVKAGVVKKKLDTRKVTQDILSEFPEISWVSVGIDGTKLEIQLVETIEEIEIIDKDNSNSVYASEKGVVTKIIVERGTPKVLEGDIVDVGDMLISSEILIGELDLENTDGQTIENVSAEGKVMARVWREAEEEVNLNYEEKIYTGEKVYNWVVVAGDKVIDVVKPSFPQEISGDMEIVEDINLGIGEFDFGINILKEEYALYCLEERQRTEEQAKELLYQRIRSKLESGLTSSGVIETLNIDYELHDNTIRGVGNGVIIDDISIKGSSD